MRLVFIVSAHASAFRTGGGVMSFLTTFVTGDVAEVPVDVSKCDTVGRGSTEESILQLPVGYEIVRSYNGGWITVITLQEVVLQVIEKFPISGTIAPREERDGGGSSEDFGLDFGKFLVGHGVASCLPISND